MPANRFWQIWYYISILGLFGVGLTFVTNSTCFGQTGARCDGVNVGYTIFVVSLALINFYIAYRMYKYHHLFLPPPKLKFSWRGDRAFPASFIIFFILAAVFLGEYLPVVIGFLGNHYNAIDAKPSPFDLGGFGDAALVYVIYAVFGSVMWLLFRFFSWPIILIIGALIGGVAEVFLFLNEANPAEDTVNPAFIVSSILVWGGMISVLPQVVYQNIVRRWARRGAVMAIIIVLGLNVASIGFFAYEKYILKHVNYTKTGLPVGICPDRLVDKVGQPTIVHWQGTTYNRMQKGAYEWVNANCPGVIERVE